MLVWSKENQLVYRVVGVHKDLKNQKAWVSMKLEFGMMFPSQWNEINGWVDKDFFLEHVHELELPFNPEYETFTEMLECGGWEKFPHNPKELDIQHYEFPKEVE